MSRVAQELEQRKEKAELYYGDELCQEKTKLLLKEVGMPNGLLPLEDILECGYVEETGFVWLKQRKKKEHTFQKIGKLVSYGTEVSAYVEKNKIKKLTGVKAKELLVWLTICEITNTDILDPADKVTFKTTSGLYRTFPSSAFQVEEAPAKKDSTGVAVPAPIAEEKNINGATEEEKKKIAAIEEEKKNPLAEEMKNKLKKKIDEPIKEAKKDAAIY